MNGQNLLMGLSYIDRKFIEESEQETISVGSRRRTLRRPLLIAAVIAMMLLLVGCAVVYVLRLQDLKIGTHTVIHTQSGVSDTSAAPTEIQLEVLSLQGIKDSPNYLANQEWLEFTQSYEPELGDYWESDEAYWAYNVLNQTMVDKVDELCAKYGLKVIGKPWHEHVDCNEFLALVGVDSLLKADSDAILYIPQGRFFPGGSFTVYGSITIPDIDQPLSLTYDYVKKDVFYDVFAYVNSAIVTERNYTTADGTPLLLIQSDVSGMIMADREDCFISLSVSLCEGAALEAVADQFDFTIQSTQINAAAAAAREQVSLEAVSANDPYKDRFSRATYREYVEDLLQSETEMLMMGFDISEISRKEYAFHDVDGNGEEELLIKRNGKIGSIVGMKDGKTDEGKSYDILLYEGNVLIDHASGPGDFLWYHIFQFANDDDPVFSNPKERSIVRLMRKDGVWWRTSSTDHYAEFDTQITEEEAMEILNSYKPMELDFRPLTEFEEP